MAFGLFEFVEIPGKVFGDRAIEGDQPCGLGLGEFGDGALEDKCAFSENGDAVAELLDLTEEVAVDENGDPLAFFLEE